MFSRAGPAEIIRANRKDEYYVGFIKSSLADIAQRFFGPRKWLLWRKELDVVADLGYLCLTTLAGFQTLGEEYVNVIQVDDTLRSLTTRWTRLLMILLQVAAPYILDNLLARLEKQLRTDPYNTLSPEAKETLLRAIPVIRHTITILHRCHLALFYMKGIFYHISKRFTSTNYLLVRGLGSATASQSYRVLGWLSIAQLVITFLQHLYNSVRRRLNQSKANVGEVMGMLRADQVTGRSAVGKDTSDTDAVEPSLKCVLCLETRTNTTTTPCGHLFCWTCITEWCQNKAECPLCRESFQISRLVCLQNYDPS